MVTRNVQDLLLAPHLSSEEVSDLLSPYGFSDIGRVDAILQAIADEPRSRVLLASILEPLLIAFGRSAAPDQALLYFERFTEAALNKLTLLSYLKETPHALALLARTFGASPFMAQVLHRSPYYLYLVADPRILEKGKSRDELSRELRKEGQTIHSSKGRLDFFRAFKRRELLRIGVRDLLRETPLVGTMEDLSILAEVLVQSVLDVCRKDLKNKFGRPLPVGSAAPKKFPPSGQRGFVILGMGKLGGGELNFSSDIDLLYVYDSGRGTTSGLTGRPETRIPNEEFYRRLAQSVTAVLNEVTEEGNVFRVDLRLRPEGKAGSIADSLSRYIRYYQTRGKNWERMALLKAWPVAGDIPLGRKFLKSIESFVYPKVLISDFFQEVLEIKQQIERKIASTGGKDKNIKLGTGGIREVEFFIQALQVSFGKRNHALRDRNTVGAIGRLHRFGLLTGDEEQRLRNAYLFLRDVEHKLQMVYEAQTHSLPEDPQEMRRCALRVGYHDDAKGRAEVLFLADLERHRTEIHRMFCNLFYAKGSSEFVKRAASRKTKKGRA